MLVMIMIGAKPTLNSAIAALTLLTVAVLAGVVQAQPPGRKLSGPEIQNLVFGKVWDFETSEGRKIVMTIAKDGAASQSLTNDQGRAINREGQFRIYEANLCRRFPVVDQGNERCFAMYQHGERLIMARQDGGIAGVWTPHK